MSRKNLQSVAMADGRVFTVGDQVAIWVHEARGRGTISVISERDGVPLFRLAGALILPGNAPKCTVERITTIGAWGHELTHTEAS